MCVYIYIYCLHLRGLPRRRPAAGHAAAGSQADGLLAAAMANIVWYGIV